MPIDTSIFKSYDIRGLYPSQINETTIVIVAKAIYFFFTRKLNKKQLTIALGKDMRVSSPSLHKVVKNTLVNPGATVIDTGLSSTPTIYFAVHHYGYDAGIQISASHNPKEWNGLKFFYRIGKKLIKIAKNTGMDEIKSLSLSQNFSLSKKKGSAQTKSLLKDEVDYAYRIVNPRPRKMKIVTDTANAMGILYIREIFKRRRDCQLITINDRLDGTFPSHEANPLRFETLKELQKRVVVERADLGIATDGDGDRIFFIDEKGSIIPATIISSLVAREILAKKAHEKILVDVRYIKNTVNIVSKLGGIPLINVIGHSLITEHLNKVNGAFSGESSGHFFFRETGGAESSIRVILYMLDVMARENKPISEIASQLLTSYESGEFNFTLPTGTNPKEFLKNFATQYQDGKISWLDGLTVDYPNWRFNIRSSNTEPLIRLNLEADTTQLMKEKFEEVRMKILSSGAHAE